MQKIGYFKIEWNGKTDYLSYDEYYARGEEFKKSLKRQQDNGKIRMSCACQDTENLELTITKNLIIRVKNNGQQMKHKESCPKSEVYNRWLEEHQAGAFMSEDGKLCFNVIVPTGIKTENNYSGSSESSSGSTYKKRADGVDLAKSVNALAWQKQKIGRAHV